MTKAKSNPKFWIPEIDTLNLQSRSILDPRPVWQTGNSTIPAGITTTLTDKNLGRPTTTQQEFVKFQKCSRMFKIVRGSKNVPVFYFRRKLNSFCVSKKMFGILKFYSHLKKLFVISKRKTHLPKMFIIPTVFQMLWLFSNFQIMSHF